MNDKDNELDIILNQYSSKAQNGKKTSLDELDALLGNLPSVSKPSVSDTSDVASESEIITENTDSAEKNDDISLSESEAEAENDESADQAAEEDDENVDDSHEIEEIEDLTSLKINTPDEDPEKPPLKTKKDSSKKSKNNKSKINSSIFVALIVVCVVLTVSFAIAIFGINMGMEYLGIGKKDVEITLNIPSGSGSSEISELLYQNGLIENKTLFKIAVRLNNAGTQLKPGDITLKPSMGYEAIIEELCEMRESYEQVTITFREGISLYEVAQLLEENDVCTADDFVYNFNSESFGYGYEEQVTTSAEKFYKFDGFFFPDTYSFYVGDSAYNVTKNIRAQFEKVMNDNDLYEKIKKSEFTIEEVVILASIVQAEAANTEDMKYVASVFINRLNNPTEFPKLQSDATDNYYTEVIAPQNGDSVSLAMFKDAYDTYVRNGLPAGAVGNPGLDAILAVVDAPETEYYYFCSNLTTRECFFAETLAEHEENLKKAGLVNE